MVGEYNLHECVYIVAASNTEADNCYVTPMPSALKSRMIHINVDVSLEEWLENFAYKNNIDARITSFLQFKKTNFYTEHTDSSEESYASPRTWEFASKLIEDEQDIFTPVNKTVLEGCLGEGVALEFLSFCKYFKELPSYDLIIENPKKAPNIDKTDLGLIWATVGMLVSNFVPKDLENIMTYIEKNLPEEFQLLFVKDIAKRHPTEVLHQKCLQPWLTQMSELVF